jgi:hypothetical protein
VGGLDRARAAARAPQPSPQSLERQFRAVPLAQLCEVELAAVTAGIAIRIQFVALAEIAECSNHNRALARCFSFHRPSSLFVLVMLATPVATVNRSGEETYL